MFGWVYCRLMELKNYVVLLCLSYVVIVKEEIVCCDSIDEFWLRWDLQNVFLTIFKRNTTMEGINGRLWKVKYTSS